ncbi:ABC transporter permease subunit [bacterium]|nr:ABC transporter permease subunit [bacterium]
MKNIYAIFLRELRAYFMSPIAYVITAMFLFVSSYLVIYILFFMQNYEMVTFNMFFPNIQFTLFLMAPVLTMRLVSEERRSGTIELLMTAPVSETQVILGKFLAVMSLYLVMLLTTLMYPIILNVYGNPDLGSIVTGYLGLFLLGSAFLSVGVFTSTFSKNQMISAIICLSFLLFLMLLSAAEVFFQTSQIKEIFAYLTISEHFDEFANGIIDTRSIAYFLIITVFFLVLSIITLKTTKSR